MVLLVDIQGFHCKFALLGLDFVFYRNEFGLLLLGSPFLMAVLEVDRIRVEQHIGDHAEVVNMIIVCEAVEIHNSSRDTAGNGNDRADKYEPCFELADAYYKRER